MRIAVFGAGAVGGLIAARLARAGVAVVAIARGAHLEALRQRGLTLVEDGKPTTLRVTAVADPASLPPQDTLIVTLKAHSLPLAAPAIARLCGPKTVLVAAQNGIPWWYFYREGGAFAGEHVEAVDPGGALYSGLDPARVVGCVLQVAASVPEPGTIRHQTGNRIILGEPDGTMSDRTRRIAEVLTRGGFAVEETPDIRREIWLKLWGNIAFNPVSVVTGAAMDRILADADVRRVVIAMMNEAEQVAARLGISFRMTVEQRIAGLTRLGAYKTSMLQDVEQGRPIELGALVDAVVEIGRRYGVATPQLAAVAALTRLRAATAL